MPRFSEDDEVPVPLVRRGRSRSEHEDGEDGADEDDLKPLGLNPADGDRMKPGPAGGLAGVISGAAAFAIVHAISSGPLTVAVARGGDPVVGLAIGYALSALAGGLLGLVFGVLTRNLRRWLPLVIWALVFFVSLAMLLLAMFKSAAALAPAALVASAVFAVGLSFSLPIRRRR
jgi:hypothetical protein